MVEAKLKAGGLTHFFPWGPSIRHNQVEASKCVWMLCDPNDEDGENSMYSTELILHQHKELLRFKKVLEENISGNSAYECVASVRKAFGIHVARSVPMKVTLKRCNDGFVALGTSLIKTDFKTCRKPPKSRSLCSTNCLPRQALKEHHAVEHQAVESLLSLKSKNL